MYLDKIDEGFESLLQAEAILRVTHGIHHSLVMELREMMAKTLHEVRAEEKQFQQGPQLFN